MKKFLLSFVLVFAALFTNVLAEDNPRAVIIFDASGSMWGQINGVTKIEIARDALKNVVKEWNPNVELGLTVYGHRTKGDCDDIETVIPVGKIDKDKVVSAVMDIKPKGKTPISRSLRKVAEEIKYTEEKATIILISDGKETCDPDPCGTAKELEKQGIDFVTHVIGFNVDKKTDAQLECIASATGGEYFSAKNAAALNKAMKVIAKKVEVVELKPEPKPVVKKLKNNLEVSASEKEGGKWIKAYHRIYKAENGQKVDNQLTSVNSTEKNAGITKLPVGHYVLQSEYNEFIQQTPFEIKEGEVAKVHVIMGQTGEIEISASEKEDGKWIDAYHRIYKVIDGAKDDSQTTGVSSRKKAAGKDQIAIGKYIVKSEYNEFKQETPIEVKAGGTTKVHVVMGQTGEIEISASEKEGGKWIDAYHRIYKVIDGVKDDSQTTGVSSRKKSAGKDQIAIGKYTMHSTYNEFKKDSQFEVKAGETTKVHVVMGQTGEIEISASEKEGGKWIKAYHRIYKVIDGVKDDSQTESFSSRKKATGKAQIAIGKYIVRSEYKNFIKETPFELKAGEPTKLHIVFGQFFIEAKCPNMGAKVNYEIYASTGQLIYEKKIGCSEALKVTLDDGEYRVDAKIESGTGEAKFSVGSDRPNKLLLDLTNLNHEEEIKADSQEAVAVPVKPKKETASKGASAQEEQNSEKITIGSKQIEVKGISKEDADKIKNLGAMLGALGGMIQSGNQAANKEKKVEQDAKNAEADKEFDEMSKDLDMYTK